jgi:nucleoside-diphosphate kinase
MIKPDGVQRGLVGKIITRFEEKGYKLVALKMATPLKAHLEAHYADLSSKPFFPSLIEYMLAGPVVCMVWEGSHAVKTGRILLGETNPTDSTPGSIRGDYCAFPLRHTQPPRATCPHQSDGPKRQAGRPASQPASSSA